MVPRNSHSTRRSTSFETEHGGHIDNTRDKGTRRGTRSYKGPIHGTWYTTRREGRGTRPNKRDTTRHNVQDTYLRHATIKNPFTRDPPSSPYLTILATQKKRMSIPVSSRVVGKKALRSSLSTSGQPNTEKGNSPELNQVSSTSSSWARHTCRYIDMHEGQKGPTDGKMGDRPMRKSDRRRCVERFGLRGLEVRV